MSDYAVPLVQRYQRAGVIVDTNILLLFFIGSCDRELVTTFRRTRDMFVPEDYDTVYALLGRFEKFVTTANILTEVSNLAGHLPEYLKPACFATIARGIARLDEQYMASDGIAATPEFARFGLTDAGILQVARDNYLVLTDDFRLSQYLHSVGVDVLNFNHFREYN